MKFGALSVAAEKNKGLGLNLAQLSFGLLDEAPVQH